MMKTQQGSDHSLEMHETEIPAIPARWQDVERLLRTVFTDNDHLTTLYGEDHASISDDEGEFCFAWIREVPWRGKRSQADIERDVLSRGRLTLEIVTKDEDYRDGWRRLVALTVYRVDADTTKLVISRSTGEPSVVKLYDRMIQQVMAHWSETQMRSMGTRGERGMKAGTAERVREMHRLLKQGLSQRQAKERARCDPSTYHRWCFEVTGEEPIPPYR